MPPSQGAGALFGLYWPCINIWGCNLPKARFTQRTHTYFGTYGAHLAAIESVSLASLYAGLYCEVERLKNAHYLWNLCLDLSSWGLKCAQQFLTFDILRTIFCNKVQPIWCQSFFVTKCSLFGASHFLYQSAGKLVWVIFVPKCSWFGSLIFCDKVQPIWYKFSAVYPTLPCGGG